MKITENSVMKCVLTHYVQIKAYEVPEDVCKKGDEAIERYIIENDLCSVYNNSRDWEIVSIDDL